MRALGGAPSETPAVAILAISALVGGGFFGYQAMRSIQSGNLFGVEEHEKVPLGPAGGAAMLVGLYLTYEGIREAAEDVGMEPIVLGGVGLTALTGILWLKNRR